MNLHEVVENKLSARRDGWIFCAEAIIAPFDTYRSIYLTSIILPMKNIANVMPISKDGVQYYVKWVRVLPLNQACRGRNISNQAARNHLRADFVGNATIELNA